MRANTMPAIVYEDVYTHIYMIDIYISIIKHV
jgi:hypothetical protein